MPILPRPPMPTTRREPPPVEDDFDEGAMFQQGAADPHMTGAPGAPGAGAMPPGGAPKPRFSMPQPVPAANPLARYFRVPGLHVRLPTGGAFLPDGAIELTASGEVVVWPMRTADELLLKSPDALMSGYAVERLIESCVPAIRTPRLISQPDLDVLLLAIRAATSGETMEIVANCPSCGAENRLAAHLPTILATMQSIPPENAVALSPEVIAYLRPLNLDEATRIALATYEEARKGQAIDANPEATEAERGKYRNAAFERLAKLNVALVASCVMGVVTPQGAVQDPASIAEFVENIPASWFHLIDEELRRINALGLNKKVEAECESCGHAWKTELEFNPSSFFG